MPGHYLPFVLLPKSVITGKCATHEALGSDIWSYFKKESAEGLLFSEAMKELTNVGATAVLSSGYDWTGVTTVVDVGGAQGALLAEVLRALSTARGVLLDLPEVVEAAKTYIATLLPK